MLDSGDRRYRVAKRKNFENVLRRQRMSINVWIKSAPDIAGFLANVGADARSFPASALLVGSHGGRASEHSAVALAPLRRPLSVLVLLRTVPNAQVCVNYSGSHRRSIRNVL